MSNGVEFEVKLLNLEQVMEVFNALPDKVARQALARSTATIAGKIKQQLRAAAPVGNHPPIKSKNRSPRRAGFLKRSVSSRMGKGFLPTFWIGPRAFYARYVEFSHKTKKGGQVAAHPWFMAAWEAIDKAKLVAEQAEVLAREIAKALYRGYK